MRLERRTAQLATTVLATAVTAVTFGVAAGPAQAAGGALRVQGPAFLALDLDRPAEQGPQQLMLDVRVAEGAGRKAHVSIDLAALQGLAEVGTVSTSTPWATCATQATTVECDLTAETYSRYVFVPLSPAAGAPLGRTATVHTTATAEDGTTAGLDTTVALGGTRLTPAEPHLPEDLGAGDTWSPRLEIANRGQLAAPRLVVAFTGNAGYSFAQRFANCEYGTPAAPQAPGPADTAVLCTVDSELAPGETAALDPVTLRIAPDAFIVTGDITVRPDAYPADSWIRTHYTFTPGPANAPRLTAGRPERPAPAGDRVGDLGWDGQGTTSLDGIVRNTADFRALAAWAPDAGGTGGRLTVGLRNKGPAGIYFGRSGNDPADVQLSLPKEVRVTSVPAGCYRQTWLETDTALYLCATASWIPAGYRAGFEFGLETDTTAKLPAVVRAYNDAGTDDQGRPVPYLRWDPKPKNDSVTRRLGTEPTGTTAEAAEAAEAPEAGGPTG
ncbi:hypothetical protein [Kitasatospora camelliae]|uniref:DUF11 domain-containing protein n=1 Tax=Kitasatospora camelliae TaxID=3156397 RepID=A0AAU8JWS0_9ACTN